MTRVGLTSRRQDHAVDEAEETLARTRRVGRGIDAVHHEGDYQGCEQLDVDVRADFSAGPGAVEGPSQL